MPVALPELGGFAAAALLVILASALLLVAYLIRGAFSPIPLIGGWIASNIGGAIESAGNAVLRAADATFGWAEQAIAWLINWQWRMLISEASTLRQASITVWHVATVQIPNTANSVVAWASNAINSQVGALYSIVRSDVGQLYGDLLSAESVLGAEIDQAVSDAESLFGQAEADIRSALATAEQYAAAGIATLDADILARLGALAGTVAADLATAESLANSLFGTAERDIAAGVATAEGYADAATAALKGVIYTDLESWADQALQAAWPNWQSDLAGLRETLGQDFPWLNDLIGALSALGAAGLIGALMRCLAGVNALVNLADDCIVPNCRNLSGLGNDLSNLGALIYGPALIGWLAYCAADPVAAAADTAGVIVPIGNGVGDGVRTLLGVL